MKPAVVHRFCLIPPSFSGSTVPHGWYLRARNLGQRCRISPWVWNPASDRDWRVPQGIVGWATFAECVQEFGVWFLAIFDMSLRALRVGQHFAGCVQGFGVRFLAMIDMYFRAFALCVRQYCRMCSGVWDLVPSHHWHVSQGTAR